MVDFSFFGVFLCCQFVVFCLRPPTPSSRKLFFFPGVPGASSSEASKEKTAEAKGPGESPPKNSDRDSGSESDREEGAEGEEGAAEGKLHQQQSTSLSEMDREGLEHKDKVPIRCCCLLLLSLLVLFWVLLLLWMWLLIELLLLLLLMLWLW